MQRLKVDELNEASKLLSTTLEQYTRACATFSGHQEASRNVSKVLLDRALKEFSKIFPSKLGFECANAELHRIRNQCPRLVPISTLPSEVLSHIFWLSRDHHPLDDHRHELVYPSVLLRVCSYWRQLALASPNLWTSIDADMRWGPSLTKTDHGFRFFKRVELFGERSSPLPLDLRIRSHMPRLKLDHTLTTFYELVAHRVQSLELHCNQLRTSNGNQAPLLDIMLSRAVPGALTRLSVQTYVPQIITLLAADSISSTPDYQNFRVSATERQLEELVLHVKRLQMRGVFFPWSSRAYHGLVELSLEPFAEDDFIMIASSELASILQASPDLHYLHLGIGVVIRRDDGSPPPIHLNNLQSLQITSSSHGARDSVLRMIYPGQASLQLVIKLHNEVRLDLLSGSWAEFASFATRSNITLLHIEQIHGQFGDRRRFNSSEILPLLPRLEVLVLDCFKLGRGCEELLGGYDAMSYLSMLTGQDQALHQPLRILHLIRCTIHWNDFRHDFKIHPRQKLILDRCSVHSRCFRESELAHVLECISPIVELKETLGADEISDTDD